MAVCPAVRPGPIPPLTASGRRGRCRIPLFAFEMIGAVPGRRLLALATEELILEFAVLAAQFFDFRLKLLDPLHGPRVHRLPVAGSLPQFVVLAPDLVEFLPQFEHLATQLPHQIVQISRRSGWKWVDKRAVHDGTACNPKRSLDGRAVHQRKRDGRSLTLKFPETIVPVKLKAVSWAVSQDVHSDVDWTMPNCDLLDSHFSAEQHISTVFSDRPPSRRRNCFDRKVLRLS